MTKSNVWFFAVVSVLFAEVASHAQSLDHIKLPSLNAFSAEVKNSELARVGEWMDAIETWFMVEDFDVCVSGECGRTMRIGPDREVTYLKSSNFRLCQTNAGLNQRIIASEQHLLENSNMLVSASFDHLKSVDVVKNNDDFYVRRNEVIVKLASSEALSRLPLFLFFHPFRAAETGVDQIFNGGAVKPEEHCVLRHTIHRVLDFGGYTFVWLVIPGEEASTKRMITFSDGCLVQNDSWTYVNEKTNVPIVYESNRTVWMEYPGNARLPVKMHGVRNHKKRAAEFYVEFDWRIGGQVDRSLFEKETLEKVSAVRGGDELMPGVSGAAVK